MLRARRDCHEGDPYRVVQGLEAKSSKEAFILLLNAQQ
jgi:hypothetical protein